MWEIKRTQTGWFPSPNFVFPRGFGTDGGPRQNRGLAQVRETANGNAGAGGRKREHPAQISTALDYLSWEYALFKAGRISCQEPPQRRIPAEVLTIEEIWDILLMALPCHGRRFPLSGVNFWHPQTKARGWSQWLHGRSFSPFVCSLSQLSPLINGIDKNKEVTAKSPQIPVTSL